MPSEFETWFLKLYGNMILPPSRMNAIIEASFNTWNDAQIKFTQKQMNFINSFPGESQHEKIKSIIDMAIDEDGWGK